MSSLPLKTPILRLPNRPRWRRRSSMQTGNRSSNAAPTTIRRLNRTRTTATGTPSPQALRDWRKGSEARPPTMRIPSTTAATRTLWQSISTKNCSRASLPTARRHPTQATRCSPSKMWSAAAATTRSEATTKTTDWKAEAATTRSRAEAATTPCWAAQATTALQEARETTSWKAAQATTALQAAQGQIPSKATQATTGLQAARGQTISTAAQAPTRSLTRARAKAWPSCWTTEWEDRARPMPQTAWCATISAASKMSWALRATTRSRATTSTISSRAATAATISTAARVRTPSRTETPISEFLSTS